jgi:hypothetical protein
MTAGPRHDKRIRWVLLLSVGITIALYLAPLGHYVAYPLLLVSTAVHELGHGIAAWLVGGTFQSFVMNPDASGVAYTSTSAPVQSAVVSMGGLLGPAVAAALGFASARRVRAARMFLALVGSFLIVIEFLVVDNNFGFVFVGTLAAVCLGCALLLRDEVVQLLLVFLSVQLALSVFSRSDYLFVDYAKVDGTMFPSDVQQISNALGMPYWFWGGLCAALSVAVVGLGGWSLLRSSRDSR